MSGANRRWQAVGAALAALMLGLVSAAAAQGTAAAGWHNATQLGGPTAFDPPPLTTPASLRAMVARPGMADDIRGVLRESGVAHLSDAVLAALAGAATFAKVGSCDEAAPADGVVVECSFRPGSTLLWMAIRPRAAQGDRTPGRLEFVRWAGARPFRALLFRVTSDGRVYTFVLPTVCSNLSLMSVEEAPGEPVTVSVDRACDPTTGSVQATVTADGSALARVRRVRVAIDGQPAGELTSPSWTLTATRAGNYTFDAVDTAGRPYRLARRTARVDACPLPPAPKRVVGPTCSLTLCWFPAKGAYQITVDATRSTTGTRSVAPEVTVDLVDAAGAVVWKAQPLDNSLTRKITVQRLGTYHAIATVNTPQAIELGEFRYEGAAACDAAVTIAKPPSPAFFLDALGGEERRVRPDDATGLPFAQSSPVAGAKIGVANRFRSDWEVAGAVGVAISLVTGGQKVKESELFVDAEVNKHLPGGVLVGTGFSFWDLTRRDTRTSAWLLHLGVPVARSPERQMYFVVEGRVFLDKVNGSGGIGNNRVIWAGFRMRFGY